MPFRILAAARADVRAIAGYIDARNPRAAARWTAALRARIARIGRMPAAGAPRFDLAPRLRVVPHGAYLILYREDGATAEVVRVIHASRDWERNARRWLEEG